LLADVPVRQRVVRDEPLAAVAKTCADCGPWNVVVLAEPLASLDATDLAQLFASVPDTTGVMVVGLGGVASQGAVVLAIDQADALAAMLLIAERLVEGADTAIVLFLLDSEPDTLPDLGQKLESQVRLALSERPAIIRADGTSVNLQLMTLPDTHGDPAAIAEALRRLCPGFLIARFGGQIVPPDHSLRVLGTTLQCPLLLIR
jgi:hypothetical protein